MKKLNVLLMLALAAFAFTACSDDDDPAVLSETIKGEYSGWTLGEFSYSPNGLKNDGATLVITPVSDYVVNITFNSPTWGEATFSNVAVLESGDYCVTSGAESTIVMTTPHNPEPQTYPAILNFVKVKKDKSTCEAELNMPGMMGGTKVTFTKGAMPTE